MGSRTKSMLVHVLGIFLLQEIILIPVMGQDTNTVQNNLLLLEKELSNYRWLLDLNPQSTTSGVNRTSHNKRYRLKEADADFIGGYHVGDPDREAEVHYGNILVFMPGDGRGWLFGDKREKLAEIILYSQKLSYVDNQVKIGIPLAELQKVLGKPAYQKNSVLYYEVAEKLISFSFDENRRLKIIKMGIYSDNYIKDVLGLK